MAWELRPTSGPFPGPWEGKDAIGWLWEVYDDAGSSRRVLVEVSGTAMAVAPEYLPGKTAQARATNGRSEVEKVLDQDEPPRRITLGTTGYIGPRPEAPADPGWSVKLHGRQDDFEALADLFQGPEVSVVERNGSYYLRSTEFDELTEVVEVQASAARLIRQANGAAALEIDGFEPVSIGGTDEIGRRDPAGAA